MTILQIIGLVIAALGGALTAFMRQYKIGPWNPENMTPPKDFTDLEYMPSSDSPATASSTPTSAYTPPTASQPIETVSNSSASKSTLNGQIRLKTFCDGIAQMEGANPANNNEGNCRCSPVGYAPMYGNVKCNPNNFAVFPTKALGRLYLENLVHFRVLRHPDWTFITFFQGVLQPNGTYDGGYAPSSDKNDPIHYAKWMADYCGSTPTTKVSDYFCG